jgi:hypothetical protein
MPAARRFSKATLEQLAGAKILGARAGAEHRYTGVWVVVVEGRVGASDRRRTSRRDSALPEFA